MWDITKAIEEMRKECTGAVSAVSKTAGYVVSPDGKKIEIQIVLQADQSEWMG